MQYIDNIIFFIALVAGFGLFFKSLKEIYRNIQLGKEAIVRTKKQNAGKPWRKSRLVKVKWAKDQSQPFST